MAINAARIRTKPKRNGSTERASRGLDVTTDASSSGIKSRPSVVAASIKPAFVFDGEPPRLKARTLVARGEIKRRAEREWREAVEIGDLATARTKAMQTSRLTDEMVEQSKRLLELLGIPWVQAPAEGEAQASAMAQSGVAYAAASQDFDSLLFGSPRLVKNLAI